MDTETSYAAGLTQTDWLCLSFLSGIGPARLSRLYTYLTQLQLTQLPIIQGQPDGANNQAVLSLFDNESFSDESPARLSYELLRALKWPDETAREAIAYFADGSLNKEQEAKRDESLAWLEDANHHLVLQEDECYPTALKEISVAPAFLYVEGNRDVLALPKIGIVGARKCTRYGRDVTFQFAEQLSSRGICVVSGGAMGVDTAAHQGALHSKTTPTISVMGTGLFHRYPNHNQKMFDEILEQGGALISEYPLSTRPRPHLFPPRNRIISGLSMGILVAEASVKSGSLISASYAVQQNREVFALPGRLTDTQSAGCHQLLRQGATLVRNVDDMLQECAPELLTVNKTTEQAPEKNIEKNTEKLTVTKEFKPRYHTVPESASDDAKMMAKHLEQEASSLDFDALIRQTQIPAGIMMQVLMELELYGCVENREGRYGRC